MSNSATLYYNHIDRSTIDSLLESGIDVNATGNYHCRKDFTLLHAAVANSDEELVKYLLTKKVSINAKTSYKETALHIAAERNLNIVNLLIQHGAEISAVADYGFNQCWTPLHCAIRYRNEDIAKFLLESGAHGTVGECECIIHFSVRLGVIGLVELLFKHFDKIQLPCICQDHEAPSLLYSAVENDHEDIVKFLVNKFNNVRIMIKNDELILHQAVKNNNYAVIKELLRANVDINACDKSKKQTALEVAESASVSNMLKKHVIRLKLINYSISENNLKQVQGLNDKLSSYQKQCEEELETLKDKIPDSSVSYLDILKKNIHQLSIFISNENIRALVSMPDEAEFSFPNYGPLIINRLKEGLIRRNLIDKIEDLIFEALFGLPDVFIRQVFSYFSNEDMEKMSGE